MDIEVKLDTTKLEKAMQLLPQKMVMRMRAAFRTIGNDFDNIMITERLSGRPGLIPHSRALSRSLRHTVTGDNLNDLTLTIKIGGDTAPYARIHEEGRTITAKGGKSLAIPLDAAKTATGPRYASPRDVPDLVMIKRPGRPPLLVKQLEKGRGRNRSVMGIPMFVLVKSVTIPPRLGLYDTWKRERTRVVNIINQGVNEVLQLTA